MRLPSPNSTWWCIAHLKPGNVLVDEAGRCAPAGLRHRQAARGRARRPRYRHRPCAPCHRPTPRPSRFWDKPSARQPTCMRWASWGYELLTDSLPQRRASSSAIELARELTRDMHRTPQLGAQASTYHQAGSGQCPLPSRVDPRSGTGRTQGAATGARNVATPAPQRWPPICAAGLTANRYWPLATVPAIGSKNSSAATAARLQLPC